MVREGVRIERELIIAIHWYPSALLAYGLIIICLHVLMNLSPDPFPSSLQLVGRGVFLRGLARIARQTSGAEPRPGAIDGLPTSVYQRP